MSLDKIKAKLAELNADKGNQSSGANRSDLLWKPSEGKNLIRLLPNKFTEPGYPFAELYFYYDFGKTWLSPSCVGQPDPVIEFINDITGKKGLSKEEWVMNQNTKRKIQPKQRIYAPVLVRGKEDEGVKFWGFGVKIFQDLLKIMDDVDYGDISDLQTGRDIVVDYTPAKTKDTFPTVSIHVKPNITVASNDKSVLEKIESMVDITSTFKVPDYDELKVACETYLSGNPVENKPKSESTDAPKSTSVKVDHDATNQGFEVQKLEPKPDTSQDIDDILAQFDDILEKR